MAINGANFSCFLKKKMILLPIFSETNNTAWLNSTKQRDFHTLFMESRRKHVEAAYDAVQKPFILENLNRNMWENFDIAVRYVNTVIMYFIRRAFDKWLPVTF